MGQFSVEKPVGPGSALSGNQQGNPWRHQWSFHQRRDCPCCFERVSTLFRDSLDHTPPPLIVPPKPGFRVLASPSTVRLPCSRRPGLHPDPPPPRSEAIARREFSAAFRS